MLSFKWFNSSMSYFGICEAIYRFSSLHLAYLHFIRDIQLSILSTYTSFSILKKFKKEEKINYMTIPFIFYPNYQQPFEIPIYPTQIIRNFTYFRRLKTFLNIFFLVARSSKFFPFQLIFSYKKLNQRT